MSAGYRLPGRGPRSMLEMVGSFEESSEDRRADLESFSFSPSFFVEVNPFTHATVA